ncbi:Nephrin [Portunus trituberculatus]|uniref:Nephrin n=1 Tax=Portunus trituberculatus TaxID=210409 RepID=A0A5B7G4G0_PORTR|nr:Nephrin [Portunus trituberculatus]
MDVSITASATANPGPVRYWWRRGEETLVGAGGTLRLGSATKSMAGNYSISAYSQRGAINTSFFLNIQYGPDNVMAPDRVTVSEGDAVEEVDGLVTWSSVLEVFDVSPQDYQPYHCSATNPLGSGSTVLTLRPPSRPFPPTNLTVISVSNVSVVLGWSPNLAGSRPLGYTVKYYPTGTTTFEYEEVSDGSSTGVEVGGLTPEVEYSLTAQAKNNQGRSDYVTPPVTVTTLGGGEGVEGKEERHVTSFLLLVIIMSVFGLLVLNVAAILCFLRHRKRRNSSRGELRSSYKAAESVL